MLAPILSYEDLGLIQGSGWLFQGLDLYIGERDRLALIGRNGAGKPTLLKLIAGSVEPDKGFRSILPGTHVVMLDQYPDITHFQTLQDFACGGVITPPRHDVESLADTL